MFHRYIVFIFLSCCSSHHESCSHHSLLHLISRNGAFHLTNQDIGSFLAYGNTSLPATVSITIEKANSGVCYADMGGSRAHTAAVDLAEHGVFVGAKIGDSYFFEPERTLSRGEFVAMALAAMDVSAEDVRMTGFCDDASIPTWAKGYAVSALNAGVISGVGTQEGVAFRASDLITLNEV